MLDVTISLRLTREEAEQLDAIAIGEYMTRAAMARRLVCEGMKREGYFATLREANERRYAELMTKAPE